MLIPLDTNDKKPLYEQIYSYIRKQIEDGYIKSDTRLPSTRKLAESINVSRSTTQLSYDQLVSEGYIESRPYKGYYVSEIETLVKVPFDKTNEFINYHNRESSKRHDNITRTVDLNADRYDIDFSPRGIDFSVFPYSTWRKISKEIYVNDNKEMFVVGDSIGEKSLREAICTYLHQARGVKAESSSVIIGAGNEYLMILLGIIFDEKRILAMETPTYKQAYKVFKTVNKWEVSAVSMDESGITIDGLEQCNANTAYVMPSNQYPTGLVMPVKRRQELFNWANQSNDRYIIEDDYDSEFRYKGKPIPAMQGLDENNKIIYMGTFSKSIAPAIRVGYMVLPPKLMEKYYEKASYLSCSVPRMDQNILYSFIVGGYFERHLNKMRSLYKNKRDFLVEELKKLGHGFCIGADDAGMHITISCKSGLSEEELVKKAAGGRVKVYPISQFFIHREHCTYTSTVVIGYASLSIEEIKQGCSLLLKVWRNNEQ